MMQGTGKYKARLFDAVRFQMQGGKDAVSFTWDLFEIGRRVTSTLTLLDSHGHLNVTAIHETKQWARGWDGANLDWFAAQLNAHQVFEVDLSVTKGEVDWVFPRKGVQVSSPSPRKDDNLHSSTSTNNSDSPPNPPKYISPAIVKLVVNREALKQAPDRLTPTAENAKQLFDMMTVETERDDANTVWVMMAAEVGPMQLDFTPKQWDQMIGKIRNLETRTFTIKERLK